MLALNVGQRRVAERKLNSRCPHLVGVRDRLPGNLRAGAHPEIRHSIARSLSRDGHVVFTNTNLPDAFRLSFSSVWLAQQAPYTVWFAQQFFPPVWYAQQVVFFVLLLETLASSASRPTSFALYELFFTEKCGFANEGLPSCISPCDHCTTLLVSGAGLAIQTYLTREAP